MASVSKHFRQEIVKEESIGRVFGCLKLIRIISRKNETATVECIHCGIKKRATWQALYQSRLRENPKCNRCAPADRSPPVDMPDLRTPDAIMAHLRMYRGE